jgi:hypothetical protein
MMTKSWSTRAWPWKTQWLEVRVPSQDCQHNDQEVSERAKPPREHDVQELHTGVGAPRTPTMNQNPNLTKSKPYKFDKERENPSRELKLGFSLKSGPVPVRFSIRNRTGSCLVPGRIVFETRGWFRNDSRTRPRLPWVLVPAGSKKRAWFQVRRSETTSSYRPSGYPATTGFDCSTNQVPLIIPSRNPKVHGRQYYYA